MIRIPGRAHTDEDKKQAIARVLDAWKRSPDMRLGQLIYVATGGVDIFNTEDSALIWQVENYARKGVTP